MKTVAKFKRDEILTIAEIRTRMEPNPPHRDAFHKAVKRRKLKKLEALSPDGAILFRGGDLIDYMDSGGFMNHRSRKADTSGVDATPELDENTPSIAAAIDTSSLVGATKIHADSELLEVVPVEINAGQSTASELEEVEKLSIRLPNFTDNDTIEALSLYANRAKMCFRESLVVGARALIFAWVCGTILIKVKAGCQHGKFVPWRKGHLEPLGLSPRSCQRYMKLAHAWPHLGDLMESQSGLRKAYLACGIVQESESPPIDVEECSGGDAAQASDKTRASKPLLACATTLQKRLRQFTTNGEILTPEDMDQLRGVIAELTRFCKQLQH